MRRGKARIGEATYVRDELRTTVTCDEPIVAPAAVERSAACAFAMPVPVATKAGPIAAPSGGGAGFPPNDEPESASEGAASLVDASRAQPRKAVRQKPRIADRRATRRMTLMLHVNNAPNSVVL